MKESKLNPHREYIVNELQARTPINRICKKLEEQGCHVSRSYLAEWIAAAGIKYTPRKRGRPSKVVARILPLLPSAGKDPQSASAPLFLFGLQEGVPVEKNRSYCKMTLDMLSLPSASSRPDQWEDLDQYANLSDLELLLLAYLRSDLGAPPFAQGVQPLTDWYFNLVALAMELRQAITEAIASRKT